MEWLLHSFRRSTFTTPAACCRGCRCKEKNHRQQHVFDSAGGWWLLYGVFPYHFAFQNQPTPCGFGGTTGCNHWISNRLWNLRIDQSQAGSMAKLLELRHGLPKNVASNQVG